MNNNIIVKYQEADILVKNYAKDIRKFKEEASKEISTIKQNVSSMGNSWKGDIYDSFKKNINSELAKMQGCLEKLDGLSVKLDEIGKKFTQLITYAKNNLGQGK